ncbi:hypothetical protein OG302_42980 [Streptomyces sp. NBC_01283]|nr:hypothetical protein OG302_42980 [Streptomyces sp. NBC_01283]
MVSTDSYLRTAFGELRRPRVLRQDALASLVVFLVALPLCIGVAVASGVPTVTGRFATPPPWTDTAVSP